MPKRKRSGDLEDEMEHLMRKVKKLERKIRKKNKSDSDCDSHLEDSPIRHDSSGMHSEIHQPGTFPCFISKIRLSYPDECNRNCQLDFFTAFKKHTRKGNRAIQRELYTTYNIITMSIVIIRVIYP